MALSFEISLQAGFPKVIEMGTCSAGGTKFHAMVMELLGPNLEELFEMCHFKFSHKTIAMLGLQLLTRLEKIHSQGLVHRDVKPEVGVDHYEWLEH